VPCITFDADVPVIWLSNHSLAHGWTAYALADATTLDDSPGWRYWGGSKGLHWKLTVWAQCSSTRNKGKVHIRFKH
jgi:hypothetical protein